MKEKLQAGIKRLEALMNAYTERKMDSDAGYELMREYYYLVGKLKRLEEESK
jgi:hypothetical protein